MTVVDLESVRAPVAVLQWVKQRRAELKELESAARAQVEAAMGEADEGQIDGETVVTWSRSKRRSLDQKALKEDHPELVEEYKTTTEVRTFNVVDE